MHERRLHVVAHFWGLVHVRAFFLFPADSVFFDCNNSGIQHIFQYHLYQSPTKLLLETPYIAPVRLIDFILFYIQPLAH